MKYLITFYKPLFIKRFKDWDFLGNNFSGLPHELLNFLGDCKDFCGDGFLGDGGHGDIPPRCGVLMGDKYLNKKIKLNLNYRRFSISFL